MDLIVARGGGLAGKGEPVALRLSLTTVWPPASPTPTRSPVSPCTSPPHPVLAHQLNQHHTYLLHIHIIFLHSFNFISLDDFLPDKLVFIEPNPSPFYFRLCQRCSIYSFLKKHGLIFIHTKDIISRETSIN